MSARRIEPSRSLFGPKPLRYVPASHTNVAATIAKFQRLQALREAWKRSENNPSNYPEST